MSPKKESDTHFKLETTTEKPEVSDEFEAALNIVREVGAFNKTRLIVCVLILVVCSIVINIVLNYGTEISTGSLIRLIIADAIALGIIVMFYYVTCLAAALVYVKFRKK